MPKLTKEIKEVENQLEATEKDRQMEEEELEDDQDPEAFRVFFVRQE